MQAGAHSVSISPPAGVELAGWGYYLGRTWHDVADHLRASAVVVEERDQSVAIVALDLMVIGARFAADVRSQVARQTDIPEDGILVASTHTHNAPASEGLLGVGRVDPDYERWAARQAAAAVIGAWRRRRPARLLADALDVGGLVFNRTREGGPVDRRLTTLHVEDLSGEPIALVVNFQAHPTVATVLRPRSVSRDIPGAVCDELERSFAPAVVVYLQGACGDVNFLPEFSTPERWREPALKIAALVAGRRALAEPIDAAPCRARRERVRLPTRPWRRSELDRLRDEAERRMARRDTAGWRETIGRSLTNRPDDMIARHGGDEWKAVASMCRFHLEWTAHMLPRLESTPPWLDTEIQVLSIGPLSIATNSAELFSTFALDMRSQCAAPYLMIVSYANGRIGYLPDEYDILRESYAAIQSPRYCLQFPFVAESGPALVRSSSRHLASSN